MLQDVLAILSSTPEKLRREFAAMSAREIKTRPAPNKWSVQEILAHLEDLENHYAQARIKPMLEQDTPTLLPFDQEARAVEMRYDRKDPLRTLNAFARKRRMSLKQLRKLRSPQLKRKGVHQTVGEITIEELLNEWAFHDLGHLRQIMEIKRHALYPRMGNLKAFYQFS